LARRALPYVFMAPARTDSAATFELTDTLLAMVIGGAPSWKQLRGGGGTGRLFRKLLDNDGPAYLKAQLPETLHQRWAGRVKVVVDPTWKPAPDRRPLTILSVSPVQVSGRLAHVYVGWESGGASGGIGAYLLKTDAGWLIVEMEEWIT